MIVFTFCRLLKKTLHLYRFLVINYQNIVFMNFKEIWKKNNIVFVLKTVVFAALLFFVLAWGTLKVLDIYTHHGESEIVPDLKGFYVDEATAMLQNHSLFPIVIDSIYDRKLKLGSIVEQTPKPNSTIKRNRPVYLIINSMQIRQIPLPDVNDMSHRQADAILRSLGFAVGNIEYRPSEYHNLVVAVKFKGETVPSGTRLTEGSEVVLVVGSGLSEGESYVPNLKELSLSDARTKSINNQCVIGATIFDEQPSGNEEEYFVYRQRPKAGDKVVAGSRVDIWLTTNTSLLDMDFDNEDDQVEEKFF